MPTLVGVCPQVLFTPAWEVLKPLALLVSPHWRREGFKKELGVDVAVAWHW